MSSPCRGACPTLNLKALVLALGRLSITWFTSLGPPLIFGLSNWNLPSDSFTCSNMPSTEPEILCLNPSDSETKLEEWFTGLQPVQQV
ncbi:hypothetical protein B0H11DRAFT_1113145 [Mycena galericulata]|nr:hypothetical protein B0H11DRAFT_1113145 [Mycena galericulata]